MYSKFSFTRAFIALLWLFPGLAHAEYVSDQSALSPVPVSHSATDNFQDIFLKVANALISNLSLVTGVLAVIFLIFAGIKYITAGGNTKQAEEARAGVIHVFIGVVIIVAIFWIIKIASSIGFSLSNTIS